jgi:hypothetical protein
VAEFIINPLNTELNSISHLLVLLGAHPNLHISRIRVNQGGDRDEDSKFHTGNCDDNETSKDSDRSRLTEPL